MVQNNNMNNWETHDFMPSTALKKGETHIDVYSDDPSPPKRDLKKDAAWDKRMDDLKPPSFPPIDKKTREWEHRHEAYKQKLRNEPSYQFLMKVAAFANIKLENMWQTPSEEPGRSAVSTGGGLADITNPSANQLDTVSLENAFQHKWTTIPEVSGFVYLNPTIFGHLHEAYEITGVQMPLETLILSAAGTLFARLVAIRIKVSAFLSGLNYNLDRNYQRLLQQQTLCIRAIKNKLKKGYTDSTNSFMMSRADYKKAERNHRTFNTMIGSYNNVF